MNISVLSWLKKLAADRDVSRRSGGKPPVYIPKTSATFVAVTKNVADKNSG